MSEERERPEPAEPAGEPAGEPARKEAKPKARKRTPPRNPALLRALRAATPIEGTVVGVIKGGYEVRVEGSRGFCPHSQIDLQREDDPERLVGKSFPFRVTQVRRGGEDVVLSRRALLEEQQAEEAKAVRATLVEGAIMQGRVASIANFGAFVDLGAGVLGLAHVTELAHRPVTRVSEVVRLGDTVQVKVLKVDDEKGRISLSLRQATKDPWADVKTRYQAGESYQGAVRRVADFGAFVELEPGVEALAPASEFPPAPDGWKSGLEIDTTRQWVVLAVDPKARRISLALPGPGGADVKIDPDVELSGTVQRVEGYGAFVWLRPGSVGLMPREWSGMREGADFRSQFHIGQQVDVRIVDVGEGGRKIRLARKGVEARAEKPQVKRQKRAPHPEPKKVEEEQSFGLNLGDKLRAALKK